MAINTFLKSDSIPGESSNRDHKGEIDVLSWSWGVQNQQGTLTSPGGGTGRGKAVPAEFRFVHAYDKASPLLAKAVASGTHLPQVVVSVRKSGAGQADFLVITLKEVFVTLVQARAETAFIAEEVALAFGDIDVLYKPQDDKGAFGGAVRFGWNIKTTQIR
jgi:type VI secretion system secreted protein Hcp